MLRRRAPAARQATPRAGSLTTSPCTGNADAATIDMPAAAAAAPPTDAADPIHPTRAGGNGVPGRLCPPESEQEGHEADGTRGDPAQPQPPPGDGEWFGLRSQPRWKQDHGREHRRGHVPQIEGHDHAVGEDDPDPNARSSEPAIRSGFEHQHRSALPHGEREQGGRRGRLFDRGAWVSPIMETG